MTLDENVSKLETRIVPMSSAVIESSALQSLVALRSMSADEFIDRHASGSLRKAKRLGFCWRDHYLHERIAYEFGYGFEIIPSSRVTIGNPLSEGDCPAVTESCWHIERFQHTRVFPEDQVKAAYLHVTHPDGKNREGIGMALTQTSAPFVPKGNLVFALISEVDYATKTYRNAINPF